MSVFNNIILARNRELADDDRMIETCQSIFKSFNINNLSVCIGWCADQVPYLSSAHSVLSTSATVYCWQFVAIYITGLSHSKQFQTTVD